MAEWGPGPSDQKVRYPPEDVTCISDHVTCKSAPYGTRCNFFATACEALFSQEVLCKGMAPSDWTTRAHCMPGALWGWMTSSRRCGSTACSRRLVAQLSRS
jgi:hypothetical protein